MKQISVTESDVISQLRLPLIVLVTYAHSYSSVSPDYSLLSTGWVSLEVLKLLFSQTLSKVVVPVFFIISGYLFFANVNQWSLGVYGQKMSKRAKTLLVPYVVWNLLMAVKLHAFDIRFLWDYCQQAGMQTDWLGCENWMTAPANLPLWFLRDLMVVSLLTPILYIVLSRWGGAVLGFLLVYFLSGIGAFAVPGLSACALFFFSLGAYLGIRRKGLLQTAMRYERPSYVLSALLAMAMVLTYHQPVFSSLMLCFRLVGAVAVFCLAFRLLTSTPHRLSPVVCRASYFVYLAHYVFFLSFVDDYLLHFLGYGPSAHYLAAPLLKAVLLVLTYAGYRQLIGEKLQLFLHKSE